MSEFDIRNTDLKETEKEFERALRPLNFGDFQGQKKDCRESRNLPCGLQR